ncbi:MAG: hypothetical protein QM820_04580 [Minicystis sp.]
MVTNDPQMAEDVAMVAFGAACLAGDNPRLEALAVWADENLLAPGARHRREDVVVIHAARGIIERARVMGIPVTPAAAEHSRKLYPRQPPSPPIDPRAIGSAVGAYGESPIYGDFGWEIACHATYGVGEADRRSGRWAQGGRDLTAKQLAFGALAAHVRAAGWNDTEFAEESFRHKNVDTLGMDWALRRLRADLLRHDPTAPQMVSEKYVLTGCRMLHAYFASCAAADDPQAPVDPALSPDLLSNPASDVDVGDLRPWSPLFAKAISPAIPLVASEQYLRAAEWVRIAPLPDPKSLTRLSPEAGPIRGGKEDWIVLRSFVLGFEQGSQADSVLRMSSFVVPQQRAPHLGRDITAYHKAMNHTHPQDGRLHEFGEGIRGHTYRDPFEAVWAPWATGEHGSESIPAAAGRGAYEAIATSAGLTWDAEDGERHLWLPAHWIRRALGLVDTDRLRRFTRREPGDQWHDEWHFRDRRGEIHAVYVYAARGREQQQALLIKRSSLRRALGGRRLSLAWEGWLYRALTLWLRPGPHQQEPWDVERDWKWIAVQTGDDVTITQLPGWGAVRRYDRKPQPKAPPPAPSCDSRRPHRPGRPDPAAPRTGRGPKPRDFPAEVAAEVEQTVKAPRDRPS